MSADESKRQYICAKRARYRAAHADKIRAYRVANPSVDKEINKRYQSANLDKFRAVKAKRRAAKLQRTPAWANQYDIASAYELADILSRSGLRYHVDHEIPLQGDLVSGLHVEGNLRVIPWYQNAQKGNRFEVA